MTTPDEIIAEMERWADAHMYYLGEGAGDIADAHDLITHMREWFASKSRQFSYTVPPTIDTEPYTVRRVDRPADISNIGPNQDRGTK